MNLKILNSYHLKIIALATMIIDHFGVVFFPGVIWFRIIGRVAFILYAFMLVEGCIYTSNISKYKEKLLLWGIISEIPFDLVFYNNWYSFEGQNVFFTLLIGVVGIDFFKKNKNVLLNIFGAVIGMLIAYWLKVDYSWYGVALIYGLYFLRKMTFFKNIYIQMLSVLYSLTAPVQLFAFVGILPIYCYNGELGKKIGNVYYSFYALHLLLFYVASITFL